MSRLHNGLKEQENSGNFYNLRLEAGSVIRALASPILVTAFTEAFFGSRSVGGTHLVISKPVKSRIPGLPSPVAQTHMYLHENVPPGLTPPARLHI